MNKDLTITQIKVQDLEPATYNPRSWDETAIAGLTESIKRFGMVDPIIANGASGRKNIVIGGHFRLKIAKDLGYIKVPVVYVNIPELYKEKELNLRLNKNLGDWDFDLLASFDETLLIDVGFTSEELDSIFEIDADTPENFDLEKELAKLNIESIKAKVGDIYQLGKSRLLVGDSTIATDIETLMDGAKANMCFTDPPYILDYLHAIRHGKPTDGFGSKRNRRYLETDSIPYDFTEKWMAAVAGAMQPDCSIIVFENWKNIRVIWEEIEKHWKVNNMLVWHLPNRHQGYAAPHKFFSKHDIALAGANGDVAFNHEAEETGLQEEYETALYATAGNPHWEGYAKGKGVQPTDFIEFNADDEKQSGQGIIFGTKPVEVLIPYIKVLTQRDDLILEPFCGSGSTLIAALKMKRRCYLVEKSPVYAEVAMIRWEKLTGEKRVLVDERKTSPTA